MSKNCLAIDIGTTSAKALIIDTHGRIKASAAVHYPLHHAANGRAEQDPYEILRAATEAARQAVQQSQLKPAEVHCLSFSSAMHSLIALDRAGEPLTPCITWADNRAAAYVRTLRDAGEAEEIYRATGTPIHPMSPLLKLIWMREQAAEIFNQAYKFVGIKEFVISRWCGSYVVDESIASATGLYSLYDRQWHLPSLQLVGLDAERLAHLVPTTHTLPGLIPQWADQLGLAPHTPVVVGASDGVLANVGVGAMGQGNYAVTIGTSGAVRTVVDKPITDELGRTFCYVLTEDRWVVGGAINNGGILLRWVRDELATKEAMEAAQVGEDPYDRLLSLAAEVPPGSQGLIVLPLFTGERAPYWNADVRGVFFGLSLSHGKKHMIRAVLEGICYAMRSVADAVAATAGKPAQLRASGGFARSPLWRQMLADCIGAPLAVPNTIESSAVGAAALGLFVTGQLPSLNIAQDWVRTDHQHLPDPAHKQTYDELFALYQELYPRLVEPFARITQFQSNHQGG